MTALIGQQKGAMITEVYERWNIVRTMKQIGCSDAACAAQLGKTTKSFRKRWATLRKKYGW